jgi:hypothetical protein
MAATVVDAKYSTIVGTPFQLRAFVTLLGTAEASVVDMKFSNFIVLRDELEESQVRTALAITPQEIKS